MYNVRVFVMPGPLPAIFRAVPRLLPSPLPFPQWRMFRTPPPTCLGCLRSTPKEWRWDECISRCDDAPPSSSKNKNQHPRCDGLGSTRGCACARKTFNSSRYGRMIAPSRLAMVCSSCLLSNMPPLSCIIIGACNRECIVPYVSRPMLRCLGTFITCWAK